MYADLKVSPVSKTRVRLIGPCIVTRKIYSVVVARQAAVNYFELGMKIQDAFPKLPPEEREFLISGVSPEGWNMTFGESH
jgi:hypothetical protein